MTDEHIKQLEQENEKLRKNADKAKEIIQKLYGMICGKHCIAIEVLEDTEEYLKECE